MIKTSLVKEKNKNFRIFSDDNKVIYFLVPGFTGNYEEGFMKNIHDYLLENNYDFFALKFQGHANNESRLASLDEMVYQIKTEFGELRKKYSKSKIVVLAHSQGAVISIKAISCFDFNTTFVLLAPAIFIKEIILKRIKDDDMRLIKKGETKECQVSMTKKKLIDLAWVKSYEDFSVEKELNQIEQKVLIIRPIDDYLDKKNVEILKEKLKNKEYLEVKGDHSFFKPIDSFDCLIKDFFIVHFKK